MATFREKALPTRSSSSWRFGPGGLASAQYPARPVDRRSQPSLRRKLNLRIHPLYLPHLPPELINLQVDPLPNHLPVPPSTKPLNPLFQAPMSLQKPHIPLNLNHTDPPLHEICPVFILRMVKVPHMSVEAVVLSYAAQEGIAFCVGVHIQSHLVVLEAEETEEAQTQVVL